MSHAGEADAADDPEVALALAYVPAAHRPALAALFALDRRLRSVVETTSEPGIGLIRLAWWREALERLDHAPPPGEPLLQAVAAALLSRVSGARLATIEDGWAALLHPGSPDEMVRDHADARGGALFTLAGAVLGGGADQRLGEAGALWALADLARNPVSEPSRQAALAQGKARAGSLAQGARWPKPARPLAMLGALAARDLRGPALEPQGSPARVLRMLALRLTGR